MQDHRPIFTMNITIYLIYIFFSPKCQIYKMANFWTSETNYMIQKWETQLLFVDYNDFELNWRSIFVVHDEFDFCCCSLSKLAKILAVIFSSVPSFKEKHAIKRSKESFFFISHKGHTIHLWDMNQEGSPFTNRSNTTIKTSFI